MQSGRFAAASSVHRRLHGRLACCSHPRPITNAAQTRATLFLHHDRPRAAGQGATAPATGRRTLYYPAPSQPPTQTSQYPIPYGAPTASDSTYPRPGAPASRTAAAPTPTGAPPSAANTSSVTTCALKIKDDLRLTPGAFDLFQRPRADCACPMRIATTASTRLHHADRCSSEHTCACGAPERRVPL